MSVFYNALRPDPIQRDPIYDALDVWKRVEPPTKALGPGQYLGLIVSFLLVTGILVIAYGDSNLRTALTESRNPETRAPMSVSGTKRTSGNALPISA